MLDSGKVVFREHGFHVVNLVLISGMSGTETYMHILFIGLVLMLNLDIPVPGAGSTVVW